VRLSTKKISVPDGVISTIFPQESVEYESCHEDGGQKMNPEKGGRAGDIRDGESDERVGANAIAITITLTVPVPVAVRIINSAEKVIYRAED